MECDVCSEKISDDQYDKGRGCCEKCRIHFYMKRKPEITKTYVCVDCRHKFTLTLHWMIDNIEKYNHAKICPKCQNKLINFAVYGKEDNGCINCK